ncbi:MAG: glycoside hydrolase family 2 TIM barrel-domain containing protein [Rikenellaceae bacterium]
MRDISTSIKTIIAFVATVLAISAVNAQDAQRNFAPVANPLVYGENTMAPRTEFISYDTREAAVARDLDAANHFLPLSGKWRVRYVDSYTGVNDGFARPEFNVSRWDELDVPSSVDRYESFSSLSSQLVAPSLPTNIPVVQYRAEIMIPILWLDRDVYLHVGSVGSAFTLYVGGEKVGYANDNKTPTEFNISPYLDEGPNTICIEVYGYSTGNYLSGDDSQPCSLGEVYVYSQPKIHIADYFVGTEPDSLWRNAVLNIDVILKNTYSQDQTISVGYDIYGPDGKLKMYNLREITVEGNSTDTLDFDDNILHVMSQTPWSPNSPTLYEVMLYIRLDKRIIEYIPFQVGFAQKEFIDGQFYHNREATELKIVSCNADADAKTTEATLRKIKSYGMNAVCPDYPQPLFFYELCDKVGLFVIDQANINSWYKIDDRNMGGAVVNNPDWLGAISSRVRAMYERTKNFTSVVGRSMGGVSGNGYNMYKSYLELKSVDSLSRIDVTYRDLQGEWNRDFELPMIISKESLFANPAPTKSRR